MQHLLRKELHRGCFEEDTAYQGSLYGLVKLRQRNWYSCLAWLAVASIKF